MIVSYRPAEQLTGQQHQLTQALDTCADDCCNHAARICGPFCGRCVIVTPAQLDGPSVHELFKLNCPIVPHPFLMSGIAHLLQLSVD